MIHRREFLKSALVAGAALPGIGSQMVETLAQAPQQPPPTPRPATASVAKIDIHVHLGRDQNEQFNPDQLRTNVSAAAKWLVEQMDKQNIEKSLIVPVDPIMPTEIYMQAAKEIPDRLLAACSVIPRTQNPVQQLQRWHEAGARALKLQPMQYDPRDALAERLVYEAVKRGMPVLFHHTNVPRNFPEWLEHLATTFGDGQFVVIHFGGTYGFRDVLPLALSLPNVWLETSTAFVQVVNSPLRDELYFLTRGQAPRRMIFGSEHPRDYEAVLKAIDALTPESPGQVVEAIFRENAKRLLKL